MDNWMKIAIVTGINGAIVAAWPYIRGPFRKSINSLFYSAGSLCGKLRRACRGSG